ncbi:hypothetical protein NX081_11420 [Bacillus velezensis]|uniref:hypothetical protein n=1 Tax=Bacillus velezensis TaxID=492670 RepID=UPI0021763488|nr:hypothetical protein [Bacillus velezensis]UWD95708.1 hypothetical protein NX081_11420 [Bacillus velezensis]
MNHSERAVMNVEKNENGFVVVKEHYTEEDIRENQCFCFDRDKASAEAERIQNEIDPEHNEWKVSYEPVEIIR